MWLMSDIEAVLFIAIVALMVVLALRDPSTLQTQIAKLKERFDLDRVVLVGDRGI
jgi:hypothetical protein